MLTLSNMPSQIMVPEWSKPILSLSLNPNWCEGAQSSSTVEKLWFFFNQPVEKSRAIYLSRLNHNSPAKFENTFFQIAKLRFLKIFFFLTKIPIFQKKCQGTSLKDRGHICWILDIYILISTPVITGIGKLVKIVGIRGGDDYATPHIKQCCKYVVLTKGNDEMRPRLFLQCLNIKMRPRLFFVSMSRRD